MFVSVKRIAAATVAGMFLMLALPALAQNKDSAAPVAGTRSDPARIDRDGHYICGWELMNDSERAGHKSQLHFTKDPAERDQIRTALCKSMRKRADEKGVKLDE
jgi:hypothetical protein